MESTVQITRDDVVRALDAWVADFKANPDKFEDDYGESYGEGAADYFLELLGVGA